MFEPASVIGGGRFRLTLGLRPLDLSEWLLVDEDLESDLAAKAALLSTRHGDVVATLPAGHDAAAELLDEVLHHLTTHHPAVAAVPDRQLHPIDAAGRLVQEDLCVLTRAKGAWRLTAASVCFPSRWRLADKIGRSVAEIHGPVPGYEAIAAPTDAFFDRLGEQRPMQRTNWTLLESPELFQDGRTHPGGGRQPEELTFRVERQTLRRLPRTGAAVFTIRTFRTALSALVRDRPQLAADLCRTLRTVPPETVRYKGWQRLLPGLLAWLAAAGDDG